MKFRSRFIIFAIVLLGMILISCSSEKGPSKTELKDDLSSELPVYLTVDSYDIEASHNVGDEVDPVYKVRFNATLKFTEDTFAEDQKVEVDGETVLFLEPVKQKGNKITVHGKSTAQLNAGSWEIETKIDEALSDIGMPLDTFSSANTAIKGTTEGDSKFAKYQQSVEATKQAISVKQTPIVTALSSGIPLQGVLEGSSAIPLTFSIVNFDDSKKTFSATLEYSGLDGLELVEGWITDTGLYFSSDSCVYNLDLEATGTKLIGHEQCGWLNIDMWLQLP